MVETWHSRWRSLSARIEALAAAARLLFESRMDDDFGVCTSYLGPQMAEIMREMRDLFESHRGAIPPQAEASFAQFSSNHTHTLTNRSFLRSLPSQLALLTGFRAELDYLLADRSARIQSLTDRAFIHLQHTIIADVEVARKWQRAYLAKEVDCERLGSAHLLSHGIWAFKADAGSGGRTDLVLGTALFGPDDARRASEGLVLTEWKRVKAARLAGVAARQAFAQAETYSGGLLAGFELTTVRYVVLVSLDRLAPIPDRRGKTATYRHINIAVQPSVPSRVKKP
jgi:hypothetical protein